MSKFRLTHVIVNAKFTRTFTVPAYEVPVIKAAWRGHEIEAKRLDSFRDVTASPEDEWKRMLGDYGQIVTLQVHPGPERLEVDMQRDAEDTERWLADEAAKGLAQAEAAEPVVSDGSPYDDGSVPADPELPVKRKGGRPRKVITDLVGV